MGRSIKKGPYLDARLAKKVTTQETSGKRDIRQAGASGGSFIVSLMVRGSSRQLVEFETSIRPKRDDLLWQ